MADRLGNTIAQEGCDRCFCGCKYWENDMCVDCGTHINTVLQSPDNPNKAEPPVDRATVWHSRVQALEADLGDHDLSDDAQIARLWALVNVARTLIPNTQD
jgi:hypothetical protein